MPPTVRGRRQPPPERSSSNIAHGLEDVYVARYSVEPVPRHHSNMMWTHSCLGIDFGSHCTRVCIWIPRQDKEIVVENKLSNTLGGAY